MFCPRCNGSSKRTDIYRSKKHISVTRRYVCGVCSWRFTTQELLVPNHSIKPRKRLLMPNRIRSEKKPLTPTDDAAI